MSYDIYLKDPVTNQACILDNSHNFKGGTYQVGGSSTADFNITYNYSSKFKELFGEDGIRSLYGLTGSQSIPILTKAILKLKDDPYQIDYWKMTEGNVKAALNALLQLASQCLDGIWDGD